MRPRSSGRTGDVVLATGASGMLGSRALARLLRTDRTLRAIVLVRDPGRWRSVANARFGSAAERVRPVVGDLRKPGLGLSSEDRAAATGSTTILLHAAADIVFSRNGMPTLRSAGHAFVMLGLDCRDPLAGALRGLWAQPSRIGVYLTSAAGAYEGPRPDGRPLHFEIALV